MGGRFIVYVAGLVWLAAVPVQAAGDAFHGSHPSVNRDWVWQVEGALNQAAMKSPKGSAFRADLYRVIHDVAYYLEQGCGPLRRPTIH